MTNVVKPIKPKAPSKKSLSEEFPILDAITIEKTPDPIRRRRYAARTKSTNPKLLDVGVCQFWCKLFELNEKLPPHRRMTDTEITRQIETNYPTTKAAKQLREGTRTVNYYRDLYNRGHIVPGKVPPLTQSYRYDENGHRVL